MNKVLVLFAHPALQRSRVNRRLVEAVTSLEGVTLHDLYERYPDFDIDVAGEQQLLLDHEVVVLQHPFFWYSVPALLKEWIDLVLQHGWAFGREGTALQGKTLLSAISAGGSEDTYQPGGHNRYTVRQLLAPVELTARLCGMIPLAPFVVYGTHDLIDAAISDHASRYRELVTALRDGTLDLDAAAQVPHLNDLTRLRRREGHHAH